MMTYETWRISYQNSEQAARAAYDEMCRVLVENAELKLDAMRYRWLRDAGATFYTGIDTDQEKEHHVCEQAMDTAIDKAMLPAAPKQQENP